MKITESAQKALKELLAANSADGLLVEIQETCCGKSPVFGLARFEEGDTPETVDGIQIVIPEEARNEIEGLTIDLEDGELIVTGAQACGCGEGCGGCH